MPALRLLDAGETSEGDHNVEAVTITEHTGHRNGAGELLEMFGGRFVSHLVDDDVGV